MSKRDLFGFGLVTTLGVPLSDYFKINWPC